MLHIIRKVTTDLQEAELFWHDIRMLDLQMLALKVVGSPKLTTLVAELKVSTTVERI